MDVALLTALLFPAAIAFHAFALYPAAMWVLARARERDVDLDVGCAHPSVDVVLPCHNGAAHLEAALSAVLASAYPGLRAVHVVSDASDDASDALAHAHSARDARVRLVRLPQRVGKTFSENAVVPDLRSEVVVFIDASSVVEPNAISALVAALALPNVGVASGTDVVERIGRGVASVNARYVRFEMWLRRQESRAASIVGASGCLYAARRELVDPRLPAHVSRDFSIVLEAWRRGLRAVSVDEARCAQPRTRSLGGEYRRLERTLASGVLTLAHHRDALSPRSGRLAVMLVSHKLCRWLLLASVAPAALAAAALLWRPAGAPDLGVIVAGVAVGMLSLAAALATIWSRSAPPFPVALAALTLVTPLAAWRALTRLLRGARYAVWEPTRREG